MSHKKKLESRRLRLEVQPLPRTWPRWTRMQTVTYGVTRSYEFYTSLFLSFEHSVIISNLQMRKQPQRGLMSKVIGHWVEPVFELGRSECLISYYAALPNHTGARSRTRWQKITIIHILMRYRKLLLCFPIHYIELDFIYIRIYCAVGNTWHFGGICCNFGLIVLNT